MTRVQATAVAAVVIALAVVTGASAHIERASYWPNPAADRAVSPPAGGKVPAARSLFTALQGKPAGRTRVVCQGAVPSTKRVSKLKRAIRRARKRRASAATKRSLKRKYRRSQRRYRRALAKNTSYKRLKQSVYSAHRKGYKLRPTQPAIKISRKQGKRLLKFNQSLLKRCKYKEIQPAVTASRNNDRVVIMPGTYTEPTARKQPTHDPKCQGLTQQNDRQVDTGGNQTGAVSYAYHMKCPNDQNLIAVLGRANGKGTDPQPPLDERRGIPNTGACIRCNVQMEGSGASPDDVIIDAGRVASGDHGPATPKKDVAVRADRADGFVLRNVKVRHAAEHGIYVIESDGYLLERFKAFYNEEYGVLTFVEDHGVMQDCEAAGSGDSGLYPGAAAETGEENREGKGQFRYNQVMRRCDSHHNASGYSGTASNAVHIHHNNFYDNALGFTTDVFTAAGHPGFPQDSDLVEDNNFYSNNFDPFAKSSDVVPTVPVPVGTGLWIAGGNNNTIRNNHFWDNWRRGIMIFAVPDAFVCAPPEHQAGCDPNKVSTSHRNRVYGNTMGRTPGNKRDPNGVDLWWDNFPGNANNCWYNNIGREGTTASIATSPSSLPSNCGTSLGNGPDANNEAELLTCLAAFTAGPGTPSSCTWFGKPPEPH